jgi:hypothetical protein
VHRTSKHTPDLHPIIDKVIRSEIKPGSSRLMNEVGPNGRTTGKISSALARGAVWATLGTIIRRSERSEISTMILNYFQRAPWQLKVEISAVFLWAHGNVVLSSATSYRQYCFTGFTVAIARPAIPLERRLRRRVADAILAMKKQLPCRAPPC